VNILTSTSHCGERHLLVIFYPDQLLIVTIW